MPLSCWITVCSSWFIRKGNGWKPAERQGDISTTEVTPFVTVCLMVQTLAVAACNLLSGEVCFRFRDMHLNALESPGDTFDEYFINHNSPFITGDRSYSNNVFTSTISNRIHSALLTRSRLFFSSARWLLGRERQKREDATWNNDREKKEMAQHSHSWGLCVV